MLGVLLLVRVVLSGRDASADRPLAFAVGALALLAGWTLLSAVWSSAPWRALVEFDRVILYLLALGLFGSFAFTSARARAMARALAAAFAIVCLTALFARLLPDLYPAEVRFDGFGLAYPVTYANTLGLLAILGLLLCLHVTSDVDEPRRLQVLAAAAVPLLATTLVLTGSRGAALAGAVGLAAYVAAARPRMLGGGLVATVPPAALACASAAGADALATPDATSAAALAQGHTVTAVVGLSIVNSALLRWLVLRFGARLGPVLGAATGRRVAVASVVVAVAAVAVTGGVVLGERSTSEAGPSARVDHWRVALAGFADAPLKGNGGGTYELLSQRERTVEAAVRDAHSLPLETLSELGLAGIALLVAAMASVIWGLVRGLAERDRGLVAAVLALTLAWMAHAAIDWDWEMPVVTLPVLALCGAALGARHAAQPGDAAGIAPASERSGTGVRAAIVAVVLPLVIIASLVATSEAQLGVAAASARAGDCGELARQVTRFPLSARPEAHEAVGRCELARGRRASGAARARRGVRATTAFAAAVRRDPGDRVLRDSLRRARRLARAGSAR